MILEQLDTTHLIALAAALGWASGMRLYAVVFLTGLAGYLGWVPLPPGPAPGCQPPHKPRPPGPTGRCGSREPGLPRCRDAKADRGAR